VRQKSSHRISFAVVLSATKQQSLGGRKESWRQVFWVNVRRLRSIWWSRLACFGGKRRLHFLIDESTKVDSAYYVVDDCSRLLPSGYIFQQDGALAHTARATQNWLQTNRPDFIAKDQWHPTWTLGLPCLGGNVGGLLQRSQKWRKSCRWSGTAFLMDQ